MADLTLENRDGLPDALRVLIDEYPREGWEKDPGFNGLIQFWLDRHLMFRRLLTEMRSGTESVIDRKISNDKFSAMVSRYGGMFVNGLHEHHTIEDTYYFPKLSQYDKRISRGFDILDKDHHALDVHLGSFVENANALIARRDDAAAMHEAAGAFHSQLSGLEGFINRHLLDEEDLIVPVILRYGAAGLG